MSNLNTFVDKVKTLIDGNAELKNSVILNKVLESVRYTGDDVQFLTDLKESIDDVNKFLSNSELKNISESIDMKLSEYSNTDSAVLQKISGEFDAVGVLEGVANSTEYNNPSLHSVATALLENARKTPYKYLMAGYIAEALKPYSEYKCVSEAVDASERYVNENKGKLIVLDAANYLSNSKTNRQAVKVLVESLRTNNFNPDSLSMKLGSAAKGLCAGMLESLRSVRQEQAKGFDLGSGNSNVSVFEYIGPVLVEGADVTFNVNGKFIHVSPNMCDESGISKVIEGKSPIKVVELKPEFVNQMNTKYFNTQKAFESLGFHIDKNISEAKLNKSSIAFKLNESMDLDVVYNGKATNLEEIKKDGSQMFESSQTRSLLYGLLENVDMIAHMNFVKFIMNENAASMVINLGDDYYVYDYTNEGVDTYKFDAYKVYEFCAKKFGYDVSQTFGFAIDDANSKYAKIQEGKQKTSSALEDMNTSLTKLDEALKGQLDNSDRAMLEKLRESFVKSIAEAKKTFQNLCAEEDKLVNLDSCIIKEGLTESEDGEPAKGDGDESTQPEENTTPEQKEAQEEGGKEVNESRVNEGEDMGQGAQDQGDEGAQAQQSQTQSEEVQTEDGAQGSAQEDTTVNESAQEGIKKILVTFEDGTTTTETVDSQLPEEQINKIYAPGAQLGGKIISSVKECGCEGCECEHSREGDVVEEVNEGYITVPEWAVSALVEGDFRGLTADKYNEVLQYRNFLGESGVKTLELDESRQLEILNENSMNETRQECVYLKYTLVNEGFFKKDIYGVEAPFAGITNLGLFKDGRMKKECNKFLETCAPLIAKKCELSILQSLFKLKSEDESKLGENEKVIFDAYKSADENSVAEQIKNIDQQIDQAKKTLEALRDKYVAKQKNLAPAFKYDIAITMSKLFEIKSKILEAFRNGGKIDGLENPDIIDKFKASETVVNLIQQGIDKAKEEGQKLKSESDSVKEEADKVAKGGEGEGNQEGGEGGEKVKAFNLEGKEAEIEIKSGMKLKNEIDGDEHNGTEFELGQVSEDGSKYKVLADGKEVGTIDTAKLKEELPKGGYKVVSMPENNNNAEEKPAQENQQGETPTV